MGWMMLSWLIYMWASDCGGFIRCSFSRRYFMMLGVRPSRMVTKSSKTRCYFGGLEMFIEGDLGCKSDAMIFYF